MVQLITAMEQLIAASKYRKNRTSHQTALAAPISWETILTLLHSCHGYGSWMVITTRLLPAASWPPPPLHQLARFLEGIDLHLKFLLQGCTSFALLLLKSRNGTGSGFSQFLLVYRNTSVKPHYLYLSWS